MTRWVAIFEDDPQAGWVREQHHADHFAYLERHKDKILLGGGLRPAPDAYWEGGLWILDVTTREEAVRLCEDDPYFTKGLRKGYRLYIWGRAPCYGRVEL